MPFSLVTNVKNRLKKRKGDRLFTVILQGTATTTAQVYGKDEADAIGRLMKGEALIDKSGSIDDYVPEWEVVTIYEEEDKDE